MSAAEKPLPEGMQSESDFSLSVSRALRILSSFRNDRPELGISEISRELGLSKASVSRFLSSLEMHGFVERDPASRKYRPGLEAFRVGNLFMSSARLQRAALPLMQELVAESGFTSYLSVRQQDSMVIIAALEGPGPIKYSIPVGHRLSLYNSATGKATLAALDPEVARAMIERIAPTRKTSTTITDVESLMEHLAQVREQGFAINWEENTLGVASVAAVACGASGQPLTALSLGFATSQVSKQGCIELGADVRAAARALAAHLGNS